MKRNAIRLCVAGVLVWGLLAFSFARHALEATMTLQMLAQLPMLAVAGWCFAHGLPRVLVRTIASWNHRGISGLLLASLVGTVWMLPRAMDASLADASVELAKFSSVPLLMGAPVALSWPHAGFVVRGVLLLELTATAFRLGWLYLISPQRLCTSYLLADQQQLGKILIAIGVIVVLMLGSKLLWGHTDFEPADHEDRAADNN